MARSQERYDELRARLARLSLAELHAGHRDAVWAFARAADLDDARDLHEVAMLWSAECERRTNPQQEAR